VVVAGDFACVCVDAGLRRSRIARHDIRRYHLIARVEQAGDLLADRPEYHEDARTMYHGEVARYESGGAKKPEDALYVAVAQVRDGANLGNVQAAQRKGIQKYV
jgi:hypothetical protein